MELSFLFFDFFYLFRPNTDLLALFFGKRGPPCENILVGRDLHFAPVVGPFWPLQFFFKNRDLEISKIPNIDEVERIYLASPRGLRWGKTERPDYILMFCSANVPGITYKIMFFDFFIHFWKTHIWEFHQAYLSEGVPQEVFGPWVWWGRGQVISDLSSSSSRRVASRRRRRPPPPKKNDIGTLGQKLSKMT